MSTETEEDVLSAPGAFMASLVRSDKNIKRDRAAALLSGARLIYKREVEDIEVMLEQMQRERIGMLDLSPSDKNSLILASDFDAKAYVGKDIEMSVNIRNLRIKLDVARERYAYLFTAEKGTT